ncbi:MAG: FAD:protein FMN transferase, partial [Candidatus Sulfomarinibacteraceae bacterium]
MPAIFVGALFLVVFLRQPNGPEVREQWLFNGRTMGTTFTVKIIAPVEPTVTKEEVAAAVRDAVDTVDDRMSTYRPDSELSRFNDSGTEPVEISPALFEVLAEAQRVAEMSGGAFDITVGPLVDAWGFGPEGAVEPPDDATVERLLAEHGYRYLELDPEKRTARKTSPGLRCDLSAIAKGYGVDRVAGRLMELGFDDFMVEIGGEVRARGVNAEGRVWRIGVERPVAQRSGVWGAVELADVAQAPAGADPHKYESDGVRLSQNNVGP